MSTGLPRRHNQQSRKQANNRLGDLSKAQYVIVEYGGGLVRLVQPYFYDFETSYKERWKGKTLLEVYETEFKVTTQLSETSALEESYFAKAIRAGFIRVNREYSDVTRIIQQNDRISRLSHRHEPPVVYRHAHDMIVLEQGDLVICTKPGSVPIHPSGAYRFNSLLYILAVERSDLGELFTIHRLDRLTSGLVILSKSSSGAKLVSDAIQNKGAYARKTYVARVQGRFPSTGEELHKKHLGVECTSDNTITGQKWITVSFPINVLDPKKGVHVCDEENGRESLSKFAFLAYDPSTDTSLVKCEPVTGRTHQLRLHLQWIGHPIANDPNYGPTTTSATAGTATLADDGVHQTTEIMSDDSPSATLSNDPTFVEVCDMAMNSNIIEQDEDDKLQIQATKEGLNVPTLLSVKSLCSGCKQEMRPMRNKEIWLHACRFRVLRDRLEKTTVEMDFRVPLPAWADAFSFNRDGFWDD